MIVRNEEANLPACLESAAALFDEIVVVDTGSTDRTVEIARSFGARVFDFVPVYLYKAQAHRFQVYDDKHLMPALDSIEGLGDKAADAVVLAARNGKFLSKDDFRDRTKVSKTIIDFMADLGVFGDLPESNQFSLFDY